MKIFTNKGLIGKLIIVIILMSIIGCAMPKNISFAKTPDGGVLLKPITDFAIGIGDAIINLIHKVLFNMDKALLVLDKTNGIWKWFVIIVAGLLAAVIVAGAVFAIGIAGAAILNALGTTLISGTTVAAGIGLKATLEALGPFVIGSMMVTSVATGAKTGLVAGFFVNRNLFGDEEVFPLYRISPEEIFEGKIPMLNVNFFEAEAKDTVDTEKKYSTTDFHEVESNTFYEKIMNSAVSQVNTYLGNKGYSKTIEDNKKDGVYDITTDKWEKDNATYYATIKGIVSSSVEGIITVVLYTNGSEEAPALNDTAFTLKPTIAKWYYALRTLAIVVMLLILVYIGIRIMTSSIASEKSKYKNMLVDWVVAFCLIFIMHYIMVFANNINDSLIKIFDSVAESRGFTAVIDDEDGSLWKKLNEKDGIQLDPNMRINDPHTGKENAAIEWQTDLMGAFRIWAAQNAKEVEGLVYVGYGLCFLIMVFYTIFFLATYLKRLVYLAFLTIMAPLVAMTYPIDKLNDGKAQAFDMWLKEYIFNLLLQPVHLLLYVVLISSAYELVASNVIYALVAIGFLMPAEKLIRKFFGFEKAQTPGMLANATGAAIAMNTINRLLRPLPPRHKVNRKDYDQYSTEVSDNKGIDNKMLYDGYENTEGSEDKTPVKTVEAKDDSTPPQGNNKSPENTPPVVPANHVIITGDSKRKMEEEEAKRKAAEEAKRKAAEEEAKRKKEEEEMARKKEEKKRQEYEKAHPIRTNIKRAKNNTKRNIKRAKTITRNYLGNAVQRAYRNYDPAEAIRSMNKVATGALVGAPLSIVAGAAKIASGSSINDSVSAAANTISTAVQFTTKDREPINPDDAKSVGEDFVRSQEDNIEEYKKKIRAQKTNEKIHDRENVQRMQEYLNINDYNEAQQKLEEYRDCFDANIDDIETVATIVKKVEKDGWNKDLAKTTAKAYSSVANRPSKMTQKEYDDFKSRWKRYVNTQGITDEKQAEKAVNEIIRKVEDFGVTKDGLKDL